MQKIDTIHHILKTLQRSIELFDEQEATTKENPSEKNQELLITHRDSVIQRFKYTTDLFWKVIKRYLEEIEKTGPVAATPKSVIREAVKAKIISEQQGADCITLVTNRNLTSHIYHEELAEKIASHVPTFYHLMKTIIDKIQRKSKLEN